MIENSENKLIEYLKNTRKKELLSYQVYQYLKNEIINCFLNNTNLNLSENFLSKQFNVSRTPVREAINRLITEGFLANNSSYGVSINKVSIDDLKELVQIRMAIEGLAFQLACERINEEKIKEFKELVSILKKFYLDKDVESFCKTDVEFHDKIVDYSNNKKLKNIYETLKAQSMPFRIKSFSKLSRLEKSYQEIENIVQFLESKNYLKAQSMLQEHINNGYKNLLLIERGANFG